MIMVSNEDIPSLSLAMLLSVFVARDFVYDECISFKMILLQRKGKAVIDYETSDHQSTKLSYRVGIFPLSEL